jgi:hypothetical protein
MTTLIYSDVNNDVAYGRVQGKRSPLGRHLSGLSNDDFFLDLRSAGDDTLFSTLQPVWAEAGLAPFTLARDFDGIIWIKTVHGPTFMDRRMSLMIFALSGMHYRRPLLIGGAMLVAFVIWRLIRRRRLKRAA